MIWTLDEAQWIMFLIAFFGWFVRALAPWISMKVGEHSGGSSAPKFEFYYLAASVFGLLFGLFVGRGLEAVETFTVIEGGVITFGITAIITDFAMRMIEPKTATRSLSAPSASR